MNFVEIKKLLWCYNIIGLFMSHVYRNKTGFLVIRNVFINNSLFFTEQQLIIVCL